MNDGALFQCDLKRFDRCALLACLSLLAAMVLLQQTAGWHGGFLSGQAVARLFPDFLWESATTLGDTRVLLALMLPFCLRYPRVFWAVCLASLLAALVSRGFKTGLPMERPAAVIDAAQITVIGWRLKSQSFPSGHTTSAFACVVVWLAVLGWRGWWLLGLALLAGFSRVAVGAHWPMDVLGGALAGTLGAWGGLHLSRHFRWGLRPAAHWFLVIIAVLAAISLPFEAQGYPDSLPWRIVVALWGLGGFALHYLRPLLNGGWSQARLPIARVWADETKA